MVENLLSLIRVKKKLLRLKRKKCDIFPWNFPISPFLPLLLFFELFSNISPFVSFLRKYVFVATIVIHHMAICWFFFSFELSINQFTWIYDFDSSLDNRCDVFQHRHDFDWKIGNLKAHPKRVTYFLLFYALANVRSNFTETLKVQLRNKKSFESGRFFNVTTLI